MTPVLRRIRERGPDRPVAQMHRGQCHQADVAVDAAHAPDVLTFQESSGRETVHLHGDGVLAGLQQLRDREFGRQTAVLGVSGILAAAAIGVKKARLGVYLSALPLCLLGIFTPGVLIDLCRMSTMRCRAVMQPAMIILFSAALLSSLIGAILCAKDTK
jgi:hypothetical protein